jgi:hypothetical protein
MKNHRQNNFLLKEIAESIRHQMSYGLAVLGLNFIPKYFFLVVKFIEKKHQKSRYFTKKLRNFLPPIFHYYSKKNIFIFYLFLLCN